MKQINKYIVERLHINKDIGNHYNQHPTTKDELKELVDQLIEKRGNEANLNDIDTSEITDMFKLFCRSNFNGDISEWNVSNVKKMDYMFYHSKFTGNISNWDVSNVKNMDSMFYFSSFNGDITNWDVSNVEKMNSIFRCSGFN